ncbi:MAG: ABC transporter permease [Firmicutes bacterium]|nr:ABC transporter permease [Bacillota bacterium]
MLRLLQMVPRLLEPLPRLLEPVPRFLGSVPRRLQALPRWLRTVLRRLQGVRLRALGVRFWFSAEMAAHGVLANPMRSTLTILGVAIGVASVVSLMGIGEGARRAVVRQFESLGANVVVIRAQSPSVEFRPEEADELAERVSALRMATPVVQTRALMRWRRTRGQIEVLGVSERFPEIRDHPLAAGHFFTRWHVRQRSPVAVLGYNLAVGLAGGRNPVGQTFTLSGRTFRIVGVLASKGGASSLGDASADRPGGAAEGRGASDVDDLILIPYTTALQLTDKRTVAEIWGKAGSPQEAELATVQLGRIFRRKLGLDQKAPTLVPGGAQGENGEKSAAAGPMASGMPPGKAGMTATPAAPVKPGMKPASPGGSGLDALGGGEDLLTITSLNRLVREADRANRVMTLLLGGIAAVSLLVGGLGIMNIMLVAVSERMQEIGIRRAVGAKQGDLLAQFLVEAFYLSATGAVAGTAAGAWGAHLFSRYGFETAVSLQAVGVAAGVAMACGLLFGIYPAVAASSVPPVQALRR